MEAPVSELEQQALAAYADGDLQRAIELFDRARHGYEQNSDGAKAAEMANSLSVALLQAGRSDEALQAVEGTAAVFAELGDQSRQATATGNFAAALEATGQLGPAEQNYRQAADLFAALGDSDAERHTLTALSQLQLKQRRPLEAAATLSASRADRSLRGRLLNWLFRIQSRLLRP
jgi:tetratricopeptide (TPR) repeat protein